MSSAADEKKVYAVIDRNVRFASDAMTFDEAHELLMMLGGDAKVVSVGEARELKREILSGSIKLV